MQTTQETLTTAQNERLHTLHTHEAGQPVLALHISSQQDPGIRRKYRPNEDTLQAALAGGGADNVSAIVAEVSQFL